MTADPHPSDVGENRPGPTRRALDELIRRSGVRPVASIEDLARFQASLRESDEELEAFLANARAGRTTPA